MRLPRAVAVAFFLLALVHAPADAQTGDAPQRALVERYVAALVAQDAAGLRKLYHPAFLACMNDENRDYFDFLFAKELSYGPAFAAGHTVTRIGALTSNSPMANPMPGFFPEPVAPTHEVQIDSQEDAKHRSLTVLRTMAPLGGSWFLVTGCPTEKGVQLFRERRAEGERQRAHAAQLAADLADPLRAEIKGLLAQDRRIEAVKRYAAATSADMTTASLVIDALAPR